MKNHSHTNLKRKCPSCYCQVKESRYSAHITKRCPKRHQNPKRHIPKDKLNLSKRPIELKVCLYCNTQINKSFFEDHLKNCKSKKKCKYCSHVVSMPLYQHHLEESHTNQKCKCNHCGNIIELPKYACHIENECRGVLTRNCKYCDDPVVELNYERHIRWHETKRLQQASISLDQLTNSQRQSRRSKVTSVANTVTVKTDWQANDNHCRQCGRVAMPGSSSCYNCGDK
jgi:hypothetical protein